MYTTNYEKQYYLSRHFSVLLVLCLSYVTHLCAGHHS